VKKLVALFAGGACCALALAALSLAATRTTVWTAALSAGKQVPAQVVKDAAARGLFKGTLSGTTLRWTLTYAKLTGQPTFANIRMGAQGTSGKVVVQLCGPTAQGAMPAATAPMCTSSGMTGTASITPAVLTAFKKHLLYVELRTAKNPIGEIRGQLASG
jgi:hypothetical protein